MKRLIGLDIGDKRIGIAMSDPLMITAQGLCVYQRVSPNRDVDYIASLAAQYGTVALVCGLPRNMDGSYGAQADKVQRFCDRLIHAGLNVTYQDERLTTVSAHNAMIEGGVRREDRKHGVDQVAASLILQTYLDRIRRKDEVIYREGALKMDDNLEMDMEMEIIELTDEDGDTTQFTMVSAVEYKGDTYILLSPIEEDEDEDEDEEPVVIMRVEMGEDGEEFYVGIDDDALMEAVFEQYLSEVEDEDEE